MRRGFTLIEIMLVVAALAVLAGIVVVAINPRQQLLEARDGTRRADVATIWNAVHQYMLNNPGIYPAAIPDGTLGDCLATPTDAEYTICKTDTCAVVLTELLDEGYLTSIPADPSVDDDDYSGYNIIRDEERSGRITVCAPAAEGGESIYLPR